MNRLTKKNVILLGLIVCLLLAGCSPSGKIVGKWQAEDGSTYEFFKDGAVTITTYGLSFSGDYEFLDKDRVMITMDGLLGFAGGQVYTVDYSGGQLLLSSSGVTIPLDKVK